MSPALRARHGAARFGRVMIRAALALFLALTAAAHAQDDGALTALQTADQTRGWQAVGRLDIGGAAFCTGALIATDLVLTAAHCLFDKTTGARVPADQIQFLAGWRNGRAEAYRGVRAAAVHPDYTYAQGSNLDRVGFDLALLRLDQPIRLPSVTPFATGPALSPGDAVGVVSYARERSEAPSLQELCHVLDRDATVIVLSCKVDFGASGAPVFALDTGAPRIVSVVSAMADMNGAPVALGTTLDAHLATLRETLDQAGNPGARVRGIVTTGGAKFVRP